jgi:cyclophilin family peptidyl-prolyl cis-trans isomerase
VSKAAKRERQRQNREARRQIEEATEKRRKRFRTIRNFGIVLLPIVVIFVILQIRQSDDDSNDSSNDNRETPERTFDQPPPMTIDPAKTYLAELDTSEGQILVGLDAAAAPTSVNNFVFLAREGFYDGLPFHRVSRDFVIQTGAPGGDPSGGPGYSVETELPANGYEVGSVAWAKSEQEPAGTAGSQFFIVTGAGVSGINNPPYLYGTIGKVTGGMDVAEKIASYVPENGDGEPTTPVKVNKVTITETDVPASPTPPASG